MGEGVAAREGVRSSRITVPTACMGAHGAGGAHAPPCMALGTCMLLHAWPLVVEHGPLEEDVHAWHTFSLALMDSLLAAFCASAALAFCALAALVASVPELIASSVAFRLSIMWSGEAVCMVPAPPR